MSYKPPYTITPKITNLVAQISEAIGSYYAHENLRLHRVNRIKTIHGTLAIEGNTLSTEQVTAVLEGKPVVAPINEVQEVRNALKAYELLDTLDPCKVRFKVLQLRTEQIVKYISFLILHFFITQYNS